MRRILVLLVAFASWWASAGWAAPITVPTSLNPGDEYRLASLLSKDAHVLDLGGNVGLFSARVAPASSLRFRLSRSNAAFGASG